MGKDKTTKKGKKKSAVRERYKDFTKENKKAWCIFNTVASIVSIALAISTFFIVYDYPDNCSQSDLKLTLYLVMLMHILNAGETLMNLCGLEKVVCGCKTACAFFLYEIATLVYMQVIYFQSTRCSTEVPLLHFTLLANILVFYVFVAFGVCFIFRKFCPPPDYGSSSSSS